LKKLRDGVVLACLRDGDAAAVQRTGHQGFFALHDLMHYAVETTLGLNEAFFGLMASGWEFESFTRRDDPKYRPLPAQAVMPEHLVGTLTRFHRDARVRDPELLAILTDDVNSDLAASMGPDAAPPTLTPAQVVAIYDRFDTVAQQWVEVPVGD